MTVLAWTHPLRDIPADGLRSERRATPEELAALAAALEVLSVADLGVRYRIELTAPGRYRLSGTLDAHLVQACVVSLDPVPATISGPFEALLCTPGSEPEPGPSDDDIDAPEVEVIEAGIIDLGRIVYEEMASRLDPFPRLAGVDLETSSTSDASQVDHPFAALARLRQPKSET